MVSDSELVGRLWDILRDADLETATAASVRRRLEEQLGVCLLDRKAFIRDQIDLFLQTHVVTPQYNKVERGADDSENVVKRIWAYIRENNLQDPKNKKRIICDETLLGIFRVKTIDIFEALMISGMIFCPKHAVTPVKSPPKERQRKKGRDEDSDSDFEPKQEVKRQKGLKGVGTGFLAPLQLSDSLVKFFGTGENALSRGDVVKRMWKYIKENELQDPSNKRRVICDDKLRELLEVDSFEGFTMTKLLTAHFIKTAG
nr:upstream activation factor subunit spp27-like isoform X1 [Ipomoea batatas]